MRHQQLARPINLNASVNTRNGSVQYGITSTSAAAAATAAAENEGCGI